MQYQLRQATDADYEFFYDLNVLTMKRIVEKVWGWDDNFQRDYFKDHFVLDGNYVINIDGHDAGRLQYQISPNEINLIEIQIAPQYQGNGVGTKIIESLIEQAKSQSKVIKLQVIKVNEGAIKLYEKLGFQKYSETDTHYLMKIG